MESILNYIKVMLNVSQETDTFDLEIMTHINTNFFTLFQLGIGPTECYFITGVDNKWSEFIADSKKLEAVKTYIYLKVKLIFDPPQSSFVLEAFQRRADEYEWRLKEQTALDANTTEGAIDDV